MPFGLPPFSDTTSTRPSGCTRSTVPRPSSTHSSVPSSIAIGPSGKNRSDATSVVSGMSTCAANHCPRRFVKLEQQLRDRFGLAAIGTGQTVLDDLADRDHHDAVLLREHLE